MIQINLIEITHLISDKHWTGYAWQAYGMFNAFTDKSE